MNDTTILQIIKNNIVFIVVFCALLLLYIIFLCYQIYVDSKKVKRPYVTQCPDYWTIGEKYTHECTDEYSGDRRVAEWSASLGKAKSCDTPSRRCASFKNMSHKEKCLWSKNRDISWDNLHSASLC
jgi:hypothetical protein